MCSETVTYDASLSASVGSGGRPLTYAWSLRRAADPDTASANVLAGTPIDLTTAVLAVPVATYLNASTVSVGCHLSMFRDWRCSAQKGKWS